MTVKDPEAFRTISEVSETLDVPQHILRFWETRFPQLKPLKRGGNRRYYRPGDVAFASALKQLLHKDGYTVKGVQKLVADHGVAGVVAMSDGDFTSAAADSPSDDAPTAIDTALLQRLVALRDRLQLAVAQG